MNTPCQNVLELSPADFARGAVEMADEGGMTAFRRFLPGQALAYRAAGYEDFYRKTFAGSGIRLAIATDAESLAFDYRLGYGSSRKFGYFDVCVDSAVVAHVGLDEDDGEVHSLDVGLGAGGKRVEVYFPFSRSAAVSKLRLGGATYARPLRRARTMLCFGDSITQGYDALHPSLAYTEALARFLDADLVNRGIGGDRFFPAILDEPDAFEPDIVTVAYGTNEWSRSEPAEALSRGREFFRALSARHPSSKIYAITPLWRADECPESKFGPDARVLGKLVADACAGLGNVAVVHGWNLVPHLPEFFSDQRLHPNDIGFCVYAANLCHALKNTNHV